MRSWRFAGGLCLLLAAAEGRATSLLIDTSQSQATFELRALWIKRIAGDFARVEGVVDRDLARGRFGVDVRIASASVHMDKASHADWARSPDFFAADRHPWIRFHAVDQPERMLREGGEVRGKLSLRGVERDVSFVLEPSSCPRPGVDCAVQARGEVERSDFGMDARRLVLSDRVKLTFSIRTHDSGAAPKAGNR